MLRKPILASLTRCGSKAKQKNNLNLVVGNCNSVGACGAMLGGGFSRLQANFSISIDNIISLRLVTAKGELIDVSSTNNSELLWGMKGAGHNFGIVTAAVVRAFPQINDGMHWESNRKNYQIVCVIYSFIFTTIPSPHRLFSQLK